MIYRNLDELPLFNYYMVLKHNDLKYLCSVYDNSYQKNELMAVWNQITESFKDVDLTLQFLYIKSLQSNLKYIVKNDSVTLNNANNTFSEYRLYLDTIYKDFKFNEVTYKNTDALYNFVKKEFTNEKLHLIRLDVFDYRILDCTKKTDFDLLDEVANVKTILSLNFDIKNTSVSEYEKLKKIAYNKVKAQNKASKRK